MNEHQKLFKPIKNERTFEKVSRRIKRLIFDGVLKPGDRLPSETELAHQFDVSRQTIREGLRILELSGFITIQKGGSGGPLIQTTILNTINNLFLDAFQLEKVTTEELTLARFEIERVVMDYVIDRADDSDIQRLRENVQRARMKIENNLVAVDENIEFHNLLAEASKNHVFVMVVGSIAAVVRDHTSRLTANLEGPDNTGAYSESVLKSKNAVDIHEKIVEAIEAKDRKKAKQLMESHLQEVGHRLESLKD
ncbi:MAG: FadR family transcriptional regulator [Deltaproteobacteria bacterium]|nr:FadR family transcriptional regulator [Deltaproteobacteria bacterium]